MIEIIAEGPIEIDSSDSIDRRDGWDPISGTVTTTRRVTVTVDLEFPQGYVNLEGYAPSNPGTTDRYNPLGSVTMHLPDDVDVRTIDGDEWDVRLEGDAPDWIQQAHRYQVERPRRSIVDCLSLFRSWDETDTEAINLAIHTVRRKTELAEVDMTDLSEQKYQILRQILTGVEGVEIPERYRPEKTA